MKEISECAQVILCLLLGDASTELRGGQDRRWQISPGNLTLSRYERW